MRTRDGRHRSTRRRYRAAAIAGIAAAGSLAVSATPAHAAPAGWSVTAVINVGAGAGVMTEDMASRTLWVANVEGNTVTEVSEQTRKVLAVIPVGVAPDALAADPRTGLVWVVNEGTDYPDTTDGTVLEISERSRRVVRTVTVGPTADGVAVDPRIGTVYVSDYNFGAPGTIEGPADGFISVISERTGRVTATFDGGQGPGAIAVDPVGRSLYVADFGNDYGGGVEKISEKTGQVTGSGGGAYRTGSVATDPVTREVYAAGIADNGGYAAPVTAVSEVTGKLTASIQLLDSSAPGPMAIDPRAGDLFLAEGDSDSASGEGLLVISEATDTITAEIPLDGDPGGLAVDPRTGDVFVSSGGTVSVISRC
jgi:DNA-binding beta-propeller fold protein YncE